ncbi:MAG: hypothetical protein C7B45_01315 [Sulfobacillus acidophilus]|uniref:Serine/threonine specific protein phosphatases domain-containing protein n=1 Tax=Sulfobacillus acidophilus TaxID=53633 RepID=A0A2T2WP00_9FIRM|nr:MAG: hypothetical protein C7B45_01315 [Sulfobacillus acidophilus]
MDTTVRPARAKMRFKPSFGLVLSLGLFYAAYLIIRYRGLWTENDTAIFTHDAILTARDHTIIFPTQYPHGFGYQLWLAIMQLTTHLPAGFINTTILPFLGVTFVFVMALVTYVELTEHIALSELSVLLMVMVPNIMFTLLRGNHEKLTIVLILAGAWALVRFLKSATLTDRFTWEVIFYMCMTLNVIVNDYFTIMIIWGLVAYLISGSLFAWRTGFPKAAALTPVFRLIIISLVIIVVDVWLVFPPARSDAHLLLLTLQKLRVLFLTQKASSNPLSAPAEQWVSVPVYLTTSAFRWITITASFLAWVLMIWVPFRRRTPLSLPWLVMLSFYAAIAALVFVAVPVDLTGLAAGNNLEVRNFTYFALFAVPFVALGISRIVPSLYRQNHLAKTLNLLAIVFMGLFLTMSILETTLDPAISNQWLFYSSAEKQAVLFYLRHRQGPQYLWAGPDERLRNVAATWWPKNDPWYVSGGGIPSLPRYSLWLWSPNIVADAIELKDPLPDFNRQNLVYSNGQAKIFSAIPRSPFEVTP